MTIGERLQDQRKRLGYTQQEVADKLHISRQTISNWEVGKNYPDLQLIVALSDIYNISLDLLLKGDENVMKKLRHDTDVVKANRLVASSNFISSVLAVSLILIGGLERLAFGNWVILVPSALILLSVGGLFTRVKSRAWLNISCLIIGMIYLLLEYFTYIV